MDYKFKKKKMFRCKTESITHFDSTIFTHVKRVKFKSLLLNEYIYIYMCAMRKNRRYVRSLVERAYSWTKWGRLVSRFFEIEQPTMEFDCKVQTTKYICINKLNDGISLHLRRRYGNRFRLQYPRDDFTARWLGKRAIVRVIIPFESWKNP